MEIKTHVLTNTQHLDAGRQQTARGNIGAASQDDLTALGQVVDGKVDKEEGKGLSTNDFTNEEKSNLDDAFNDRHTHENKDLLDGIDSYVSGAEKSQDGKTLTIHQTTGDIDFTGESNVIESISQNGTPLEIVNKNVEITETIQSISVNGTTQTITDHNVDIHVDTPVSPYDNNPAMDGTATPGQSSAYARGDHAHPSDTTKADKVSEATSGNFAGLDSNGNLTDSGSKAADFATAAQGELADTAYQKPAGGIPKSDLDSSVQASLGKADTALQEHQDISGKADVVASAVSGNFAGLDSNGNLTDSGSKAADFATAAQGELADTAYQKPAGGIPKSDLDSSVQASLGKADTALQEHQDISGKADKVDGATNGNFAGLDSNGNLTDSGSKAADFATAAQGELADTAYQKPAGGIPKSDLDSSVQASLGKADTALQEHQDISGKADKVDGATNGNFAGLDSNGNLTDSGSTAADFATAAQGSKADSAIQGVKANRNPLTLDENNVVDIPPVTPYADGLMTTNDKSKLDNISPNANKVEASETNGNIRIDGVETTVYTHPEPDPDYPQYDKRLYKVSVNATGHVITDLNSNLYPTEVTDQDIAGLGIFDATHPYDTSTNKGATVAHVTSVVGDAINGLDSEVTSGDGHNVQVKVTQANGLISGVSITTDNTLNSNDIAGKADKVATPTEGHFAGLDSNGNLTDSGKSSSDFATAEQGTKADSAIQGVQKNGTDLTVTNKTVNVVVNDGVLKTQIGSAQTATPVFSADSSQDATITIPLASVDASGATPVYTEGLMSASDKEKLEGIETGAEVNDVETISIGGGTPIAPTANTTNIDIPMADFNDTGAQTTYTDGAMSGEDKEKLDKLKNFSKVTISDGAATPTTADCEPADEDDTLTFVAGTNITLTKTQGANTVTIDAAGGNSVSAGRGVSIAESSTATGTDYEVSVDGLRGYLGGTNTISTISASPTDLLSENASPTINSGNDRFVVAENQTDHHVYLYALKSIKDSVDPANDVEGVDVFTLSFNVQVSRTQGLGFYGMAGVQLIRDDSITIVLHSSNESYPSSVGECSVNGTATVWNNGGTETTINGKVYYGYRLVYAGDVSGVDDIIRVIARYSVVEDMTGVIEYTGSPISYRSGDAITISRSNAISVAAGDGLKVDSNSNTLQVNIKPDGGLSFESDGSMLALKPDWNAESGDPNEILNKPSMVGKVHFLKAVNDYIADVSAPYGYWIVDLEKPNAESPYGYDYAMASEIMAKISAGEIFVLSTSSTAPSSNEDLFTMCVAQDQSREGHTAVRIDFTRMYAGSPEYMYYTAIYTPSMYNGSSDTVVPEERMAIFNPRGQQAPLCSFEFMPYTNLANVATTGNYNDLTNKPNLALKEDVSNKSQTIDASSTTEYPSSKAAADFVSNSIADIKTTTVRQNGQADNSKCPTEAAVRTAIDSAVSSAYHAAGSKTVAQLTGSLLVSANEGDVYNITDSGSTTSDFIEGAGLPIHVGDNVVVCNVGVGVYKFDLLSGFVDLTNYLTKTGDGSDVTASFTAASTRTNVTTGEKLSVLFGKIAKWFSDLKSLAFKDKVDTADIENDAVTADKVKDNETLPVNISGYASHLRQARCRFSNNQTGYRLMAYLPPESGYSDTLYVFNIYEARDAAVLDSGVLKGTLNVCIRNNDGSYQYSSSYSGYSLSEIGIHLRVDASTHGVNLYAAKSNSYYSTAIFELLNAYEQNGTEMNPTMYVNSTLLESITGTSITPTVTLLKQSGGTIPLANNSGVGSATEPVYVSNTGEVLQCTPSSMSVGTASFATVADTGVKLPTAWGAFDVQAGYRLLATMTAPSAYNDRICTFNVFETRAGMSEPYGQLGTLSVQIRNNNGPVGYGASYCGIPLQNIDIVVRSNNDQSMSIYAYSSGNVYGGLQLALASSSGYTGNPTGREGLTLYLNNSIQATVTGSAVTIYKTRMWDYVKNQISYNTVNVNQVDNNTETSSFTFVNGHIYHLTMHLEGSFLTIHTSNSGTGYVVAYIGSSMTQSHYSCRQLVDIQSGVITSKDIKFPINWKAENISDSSDNQLHVVVIFNQSKYAFTSVSDYELTLMGTDFSGA